MKRILLLSVWILLLSSCKNIDSFIRNTFYNRPLHFNLTSSQVKEPIALLNLKSIYHLFYSTLDGSNFNKRNYIGHATSKDLIHWSIRSRSVFPEYKKSILLGGIVLDTNNLTGYGTSGNPPMIAVLTSSTGGAGGKGEMKNVLPLLAYSIDDGDSWTRTKDSVNYPASFIKNPQNVGIFWHQLTRKWIMSIALNDHAEFYSSADLKNWNFESLIGRDFFPEEILWKRSAFFPAVDDIHWILLADIIKSAKIHSSGGTVYFVGYFDGHNFINQSSQLHWLDYGQDIYGSLISVGDDDRRINIGWRNYGDKDSSREKDNISGIITLPREISLEKIGNEWFISMSPVIEIEEIYGKETNLATGNVSYKDGDVPLISKVKVPMEVYLKFNTSNIQKGSFPTKIGVSLWSSKGEHLDFGFNRFGYYYTDKSGFLPSSETPVPEDLIKMPFYHSDSTLSIRMVIDVSSIECFTEGGKAVMTDVYSLRNSFSKLTLFAVDGDIDFLDGKIIELNKIKP